MVSQMRSVLLEARHNDRHLNVCKLVAACKELVAADLVYLALMKDVYETLDHTPWQYLWLHIHS